MLSANDLEEDEDLEIAIGAILQNLFCSVLTSYIFYLQLVALKE